MYDQQDYIVNQLEAEPPGPAPITPALVTADDHEQLPAELRRLTSSGDPLGA